MLTIHHTNTDGFFCPRYDGGMISEISAKPRKTTVNSDPLFLLTELLIKIDRREKVIKPEDVKEECDEDKRSSDNTN